MIFDTHGSVLCRTLEPRDLTRAVELLATSFCEHEPLTPTLGIGLEDMRQFTTALCNKAVGEDLSVVIEEGTTNQIIGCVVLADLTAEPPPGFESFAKPFAPILGLLEQLEAWYLRQLTPGPPRVLHLFMAALDLRYSRTGLGTRFLPSVFEPGKRQGFESVICEATGIASQTVCRNAGMRPLHTIEYGSFEFEGERPFASIQQPPGCVLFEKALTS